MLGYLSLDIICSSRLTVFLELRSRKTVRFSEQIMSEDKYPSLFSRQMKAIVYLPPSLQIRVWNPRITAEFCHLLWYSRVNVVHQSESTTVFAQMSSYALMRSDVICTWRHLLSIPCQSSIFEDLKDWQPCYQVSFKARVPTNESWSWINTPPRSLPNEVNLPPGGRRWCWHVALLTVKTATGILTHLIENRSLFQRVNVDRNETRWRERMR